MTNEEVQDRMKQLMVPIDEAIMNTDSPEDILMLASIMMTTAIGIFETSLGKPGTKALVTEMLANK